MSCNFRPCFFVAPSVAPHFHKSPKDTRSLSMTNSLLSVLAKNCLTSYMMTKNAPVVLFLKVPKSANVLNMLNFSLSVTFFEIFEKNV